jgi:hypothetical protein
MVFTSEAIKPETKNQNMNAQKKITLSTFKSFVSKNSNKLMIQVRSEFCGMSDCVMESKDRSFSSATFAEYKDTHTLGINGIYLVLNSRDTFRPFFNGLFSGIEVTNCCGRFIVAVKSEDVK